MRQGIVQCAICLEKLNTLNEFMEHYEKKHDNCLPMYHFRIIYTGEEKQ